MQRMDRGMMVNGIKKARNMEQAFNYGRRMVNGWQENGKRINFGKVKANMKAKKDCGVKVHV